MFCALLIGVTVQAQFTHPMLFEVNAPASIQGSYNYGPQSGAGWGITALPSSSVSGQLVWAYDITPDSLNCDTVVNDYSGKIVMVRRGVCGFSNKMLNVQRAGAIGCVVCNNQGGTAIINMAAGTAGGQITIPAVSISEQDCAILAARLAAGDSVAATFRKPSISEGIGFYQYETPQHQIQTLDGLNVDVMNTTSTAANNIITSVRITNPYGVTTTLLDTIATLLPDSTTNSVFSGSYTPADFGIYNMVFKSSLNNDSIVRSFKIGNNQFTQDEQSNYTWLGIQDADFATAGYRFDMGNVYLTGINGATVKKATFSLFNGDLYLGQVFQLQLYEIPTTATGAETDYTTFPLVAVGVDTIDAADTADYTLITKPLIDVNTLLDSVQLLPNRQYMMVVSHQGNGTILQSPRYTYSGTQPLLSLGTTTYTDRLYLGGFTGNQHAVVRLETTQSACSLGATATATNPVCTAGGTATVQTTGGGAPFTYIWNNGQTTGTAVGLATGSYNVTVTNAFGCSATASASVGNGTSIGIGATFSSTGTDCSGTNGTATATPSNGVAPYTYLWSNASTDQTATNLSVGTYSVTVTDANGCVGSLSNINVAYNGTAITSNTPVTTASSCGAADGTAEVSPNNGTAPYSYLWSNGETTQQIANIGAGTYSVTITDNDGCSGVVSNINVSNLNAPSVAAGTTTNTTCNGLSNGSSNVVVSGGTAPFTYLWSNGETSSSASGLAAGVYNVSVTDAGSCVGIGSVTIGEPTAIVITVDAANTNDPSCNGGNNGSAAILVSGGTAGYSYVWSNGGNSASINGLTAGSYVVTVLDANGCPATSSVNVAEPAAISGNATATNTSASGATDGSVSLAVNGGSGAYTYLWSNGATTQNLNNVGAGTYSVTITDANGCTNVASATVQVNTTAVNINNSNISVNLFPNPTENFATLQVSLAKASELTIEVITMNGQVISRINDSNVLNNQYTLNTAELTSGVYIVRLIAGSETATYRLIKR